MYGDDDKENAFCFTKDRALALVRQFTVSLRPVLFFTLMNSLYERITGISYYSQSEMSILVKLKIHGCDIRESNAEITERYEGEKEMRERERESCRKTVAKSASAWGLC